MRAPTEGAYIAAGASSSEAASEATPASGETAVLLYVLVVLNSDFEIRVLLYVLG